MGARIHDDGSSRSPSGREGVRLVHRLLVLLERRVPKAVPHAKRWLVEQGVPLNRAIGLRIDEIAPDSSHVVLSLPGRRRNRNVGGTIHGAVITALAETVHGVAVLWQFSPARHAMVSRELHVEFIGPARGDLRVEFGLDDAQRRKIDAALSRQGRCDIQLECLVTDTSGVAVARLRGSYLVRRRG
jgi:acyl-coenzyme A thioesterase PaaI-like protein